jgi:hypothetical protein
MEYGALIREAWSITRRYRFLRLLGLLAGGGSVMVPTESNGGGSPSGSTPANPSWLGSAVDAAGVGLSASGLATFAAGLGALLAVSVVGSLPFAALGFSTPLFAYVGLGGLLLVFAALTLVGITNTFFWSYWTLVYLRLSGRPEPMETVA